MQLSLKKAKKHAINTFIEIRQKHSKSVLIVFTVCLLNI